MANTIKVGFNFTTIEISAIDSNWIWSTTLPAWMARGVRLFSIQFKPGATDDKCIIRDATGDCASIFECKCRDVYDDKCKYFPPHVYYFPKMVFSEGTYNAAAKIIITLRES